MSVTYNKLSERVAKNLEVKGVYIDSVAIKGIIRMAFNEIGDALSSGEDVYLEGFGRFYPDYRPTRVIKSGLTKEEHTVHKKVCVRFNAFDKLITKVQDFLIKIGVEVEEK